LKESGVALTFNSEIQVHVPAGQWAKLRKDWCDDPEHQLRRQWLNDHPDLFRPSDWMKNQPRYFLAEWYGAIWLKQHRGLLSLANKYGFHGSKAEKYAWKREVLRLCLPLEHVEYVQTDSKTLFPLGLHAGWPDLFVYAKDFSSCFFCEVKGPGDAIRPAQEHVFEALRRKTGLDICLLTISCT
jgi:hypothetical protein